MSWVTLWCKGSVRSREILGLLIKTLHFHCKIKIFNSRSCLNTRSPFLSLIGFGKSKYSYNDMENLTQGIGVVTRRSLKRKHCDVYDNEPTPSKVALSEGFIIKEEEESDDEPRSQDKSIKLWHPKLLLTPPYFKYIHERGNHLTVRCYSCGDLQTFSRNSKALLTNHLKQEHPNIYETYQNNSRRHVPRSLQNEALNDVETPLIEVKKEFIPTPTIEVRQEPIPIPPIEIKKEDIATTSNSIPPIDIQKEDIATTSIDVNKDDISTSAQQDCNIPPYAKVLFEPPYFQIIRRSANSLRLTVRCCSCKKELMSSYAYFSYLKKHIQYNHTDLCKKYEKNKMKHLLPRLKNAKYFKYSAEDKTDESESESSEVLNFDLSSRIEMPVRMLFEPPFYRIIRINGERLALRCCKCGKYLTTSFNGASYLKKHMNNFHRDLSQMYDRYRLNIDSIDSVKCIYSDEKNLANTTKTHADNALTGKVNTNVNETSKEIKNTDESQQRRCSLNAENTLELSNKTWKILETIIDRRLNALVKETGYFELESKINKIKEDNIDKGKSMACELKSDVDNIKTGCQSVGLAVKQSHADEIKLQNEIERLDSLLKQRKLIIRNIRINNKKKPLKDVENLLKNKLDLSELKIANCFIIPKPETSNGTSNTECVLIELLSPEDCRLVLSQVEKFNNIGISIEPVLSPLLRKHRNKLIVLQKELLRRKSDLKVSVRDATLLVNGKHFYWNDVKGLCHDLTLPEAVDLCGVEYLKSITGLDLREFINILRNYDIKLK